VELLGREVADLTRGITAEMAEIEIVDGPASVADGAGVAARRPVSGPVPLATEPHFRSPASAQTDMMRRV
jgi:hypothetical protein